MSDESSGVYEGESEAGTLLADLERRQDDVLAQLDALDRQLSGLLRGLGVTLLDEADAVGVKANPEPESQSQFRGDDETAGSEIGFAKLPSDRPFANASARRVDQGRVSPVQTRSARAA